MGRDGMALVTWENWENTGKLPRSLRVENGFNHPYAQWLKIYGSKYLYAQYYNSMSKIYGSKWILPLSCCGLSYCFFSGGWSAACGSSQVPPLRRRKDKTPRTPSESGENPKNLGAAQAMCLAMASPNNGDKDIQKRTRSIMLFSQHDCLRAIQPGNF